MEIDRVCLNEDTATERGKLWWDRWWVDRAERAKVSRPASAGLRPIQLPGALPTPETKRYVLSPDGQLMPA
jgi:hypothetical protein